MWNTQPRIFEDEDEEKLIADFVGYSARYPNYDAFEVAQYVFRNQRDGVSRANQAAMIWSKDLAIKVRIDEAKLNVGFEAEQWTKEKLQSRILAVTEDPNLGYQEKKARIEGYMAIAQMEGYIIKAVDKTVKREGGANLPTFVFAPYPK